MKFKQTIPLNVIDYKKVNDGLFATMVLRPIFNEIVPLAEMETEWKIRNLDGKLQNYGVIEKKYPLAYSINELLSYLTCFYGFQCPSYNAK